MCIIIKDCLNLKYNIEQNGIVVESTIDKIEIPEVYVGYEDAEGNTYQQKLDRYSPSMKIGDNLTIYINKNEYTEILYSGGIIIPTVINVLLSIVFILISGITGIKLLKQ